MKTENAVEEVNCKKQNKWHIAVPRKLIIPITSAAILAGMVFSVNGHAFGKNKGGDIDPSLLEPNPSLVLDEMGIDFMNNLIVNNQYLGLVSGSDSNHVVSIGGGYPFNPGLPEMYSETPWGGIDYHYAVVYLTDGVGNVIDSIDLRDVVKKGDILEAWYEPEKLPDSGNPVSPGSGNPAFYWNSETGLAVSIAR